MIKKIKSFTIIEILITIMVVSIMSIGVMGGYKFFQDELVNQSTKKKLLLIRSQMENIFSLKMKNFILSSGVWAKYAGSTSLSLLYEVDKLQPIIDDNNSNLTEDDFGTFWNIGAKDLKDFANKPFDIVIENKYFTHYTKFPYKNIFIVSWGRLNSFPSWQSNIVLKSHFIHKENNESWVFKTFSEMNTTAQTELETWALSHGFNKEIFNKEITYITASNLEIMKNKVEASVNKFNNIVKNIEYWVDAKIKLEDGTGALPGKNYFMFAKTETETEDVSSRFIVNNTATPPATGTMQIDNRMIDIQVDKTPQILFDGNLTNIFSFVDLDETDGENTRYISTKNSEFNCIFNDFDSAKVTFTNALPISSLTDNDLITCNVVDVNGTLFSGTKKMMGIISEFDGKEEISGFPIVLSNVDESNITLEDAEFATVLDSTATPLTTKIFKNNIPKSEVLTNGTYRLKNSPPYSLSLIMIFPWIIESDETNLSERNFIYSNYGWYKKEIFAVTNGI